MTSRADLAGGRDHVDILLVDDDAAVLAQIQGVLEERDPRYRVTAVASPGEAEDLLSRRSFHLVLLDYRFQGGGDGFEVIRALKTKAHFTPTVMVTAPGDENVAMQALREGALDFVPKTAGFVQVLADVASRAIERGRIIRERIATQRDLRMRNRDLQVINEIATALNETRERTAILDVTSRRLGDLLGAERVIAYQCDATGRYLQVVAPPPPEGWTVDEPVDVPAGGIDLARERVLLVARAVRERQVICEPDECGDLLVAVPLLARAHPVGALQFQLVPGRDLPTTEAALAATIGKQVGIALEHARLFEELSTTRAYLQDLVDNAADEIVTVDADGRVTSWNAGAEAIYGWATSEMVGRSWEDLWSTDRRAEARDLLRRVLDGQTVRVHETVRVVRDGSPVDILLTLSPLGGSEGPLHGVSCVGKNVTVQKQLQAQLLQSDKMVAVGQLISGVAHELNNPLTTVLGYAQLVAEAEVTDTIRRYVETIAAEASRSQRIVQNLLAFARNHEPRAERIDLNRIVRETLDLRRYDVECSGVEIAVDLEEPLPTTLADAHQLQQVFVNLLTNAQHALRTPRGRPRLVVRTRRDERGLDGRPCLTVAFEDNGPGVPHAHRRKIFDPFFTTKGAAEGTGLGLSLAYGIVQEHGGRLAVGDAETGGARFEVRLPVMPEIPLEGESRGTRRRILVVDRSDAARSAVADALRCEGHDVESARDDGEALAQIRAGRAYDALVIDAGNDARAVERVCREVRATRPELARNVLVMGSDARHRVLPHSRNWLAKPFGAADVRNAVSRLFDIPASPRTAASTTAPIEPARTDRGIA